MGNNFTAFLSLNDLILKLKAGVGEDDSRSV